MTEPRQADAIMVSVCVAVADAPAEHVHLTALDRGGIAARAIFTPQRFGLLRAAWAEITMESRGLAPLTVTHELDAIDCAHDPAPCVAALRSAAEGAFLRLDFLATGGAAIASARVPVAQLGGFLERAASSELVAGGGVITQPCEVAT